MDHEQPEEKALTEKKYKISLVQDDKEIIDVIVPEAKLEETCLALKNNDVIWHDKSAFWVNSSRVRYAAITEVDDSAEANEEPAEKSLELDASDG